MTAATDPVPTEFLLDFTDILLPVIQKIVNLSLQSGIVPEALKKVIVKLLVCSWKLPAGFKPSVLVWNPWEGGFRAAVDPSGCHRLASQIPVGFRCGHSTVTVLLHVLNDLLSMTDAVNNALLVLLNLSAAFDTIDHSLLKKLHGEIFVKGTVLDWFMSYLSCRFQQVLVGQSYSAETPLLCVMQKGLVLGPLLFSLYIRQLAEFVQKHSIDYHLFADDSEFYWLNGYLPCR